MRIQHNIMAMNAYRNYSNNTSAISKNLEKLSSGYKINRAGDDAAGLAISEKMRAQITGLKTAQKNAKDGISLVQTGEGALTEVHDMLNRMYELAEQSSNGTYDNNVDRANLQKEVNSLRTEINRIADSVNFNGINLLDGSLADSDSVSTSKQLMDIGVTVAGGNTSAGRVDAQAAKHVFTNDGDALAKNDQLDAFEITFKNKAGETKTIKLVEGAVDGIAADTGASIADALSGASAGLSLAPAGGSAEDLAEFRELFDIKGVTDAGAIAGGANQGISIQAKDATSGAELVSLKAGTGADSTTALGAVAAQAEDVASKKAESAGYAIDLNTVATAAGIDGTSTNVAAGDKVKIGDTTYEFVDASGDATTTAGATAVVRGADDGSAASNLVAQLKKDGYDVKVSENDKSKIIFTDLDKLSEKQGGSQVGASSNNVLITKQAAAKQKTEITIGATTSTADNTMTFNYVDENGNAQSKTLAYKSAAGTAAGNATAIADILKNDADLVKLFDVKDNGTGKITIEARGTGVDAGSFSGMVLGDATATQVVTKTAGADEGKTVALKAGENLKSGDTVTVNGKTYEFSDDSSQAVGNGNTRISLGASGSDTLKNLSKALEADGVKHTYDAGNNKLVFADKDLAPKAGGLTLQIGDTAEDFNKITVKIADMHASAMGIGDIDISLQDDASDAMAKVKDAINYVSNVRGDLGATQNRLEHTINNLSVMQENIQDAESSIRDVDVAEEMMTYTKNNILVQSAQAMLAQANQLPQGVLQLLQ